MLNSYNCIPECTLFEESSNELTLIKSPLITLLVDLRYNFRDKLEIADEIIRHQKKSVKNLFSERDHILIKKLLNKKFLKRFKVQQQNNLLNEILRNNCINKNTNSQVIKDLIALKFLIEIDNSEKYEYFYKWMDFTNAKESKIKTLINNEVYMAFPTEFNDKLDCQLHFHDDFYLMLNNNQNEGIENIKFFEILTTQFIIATSYSLNNAFNINASNMWGIYGGNGRGIVLKYSINDLILFFLNQSQSPNMIIFDLVKYYSNYNPAEIFRNSCNNYIKSSKSGYGAVLSFLKDFPLSKSIAWEHEKELRFFKNAFHDSNIYDSIESLTKNRSELESDNFGKIRNIQKTITKNQKFIQPKELIFGWDANLDDLNEIIEYSKENAIPAVQLNMLIDYNNNSFTYEKIN